MFRLTNRIHSGDTVREVRQAYPETEEVFERYGLRPACYDCSIEEVAIRADVPVVDLLFELDEAIYHSIQVAA